ncbi:FAD-dependent oxidoreductase domain-containing protein 1-like [Tigriopus californicus]|uniref:FAD-dependent oxidoreductase domain-containing protein 1-like n=1 Tax=Tigriopus californicus TaxID=6832 RepID=UPI0027DA188A|nr:FAD-dependent oxidoreductase domain-containing protein 1-like [Tigriopus californicus]
MLTKLGPCLSPMWARLLYSGKAGRVRSWHSSGRWLKQDEVVANGPANEATPPPSAVVKSHSSQVEKPFPERTLVEFAEEETSVPVMSLKEEEYRLKVKDSYLVDYKNNQGLVRYMFKKPFETSYLTNRPIQNNILRAVDQIKPQSMQKTTFFKEGINHHYETYTKSGLGFSFQYRQCVTTTTGGTIRLQYSRQENIEMAQYGVDFFRQAGKLLYTHHAPHQPRVNFHPTGLLALADDSQAELLEQTHGVQISLGVRAELMSPAQLSKRFPYINTQGVAVASHGHECAGRVDPFALLSNLKMKCEDLGVTFVHGDVHNFVHEMLNDQKFVDEEGRSLKTGKAVTDRESEIERVHNRVTEAHIHLPDGDVWPLAAGRFILCGGHQNGHLGRLCGFGLGKEELVADLPVEPRKRYYFKLSAPQGPGLNCPLVVDNTGVFFRREGYGGVYYVSRPPGCLENEPSTQNLDVDMDYFHEWVLPPLVDRVPAFKDAKVMDCYGTFEDVNFHDENPVIGPHPYHTNVLLGVGGSGMGIQLAPAIGRALCEYLTEHECKTLSLENFDFQRLLFHKPMFEAIHLS